MPLLDSLELGEIGPEVQGDMHDLLVDLSKQLVHLGLEYDYSDTVEPCTLLPSLPRCAFSLTSRARRRQGVAPAATAATAHAALHSAPRRGHRRAPRVDARRLDAADAAAAAALAHCVREQRRAAGPRAPRPRGRARCGAAAAGHAAAGAGAL